MTNTLTGIVKGEQRRDSSVFSSPNSNLHASPIAARRDTVEERRRPAARYNTSLLPGTAEGIEQEESQDGETEDEDEQEDVMGEDAHGELSPLLPIFSAEHLDALPVYNLTHTIRLLIVPRCETTLSWDQLRSPQVSQFLVKPIQQQLKSSHFSKATLYALMANCLQFNKEIQMNPGNSGVSKTRALVCELLAIKLLREFSTRELVNLTTAALLGRTLILHRLVLLCLKHALYVYPADVDADALSYDFNPLQGLPTSSGNGTPGPNWDPSSRIKPQARAARTSTLEIAIRAQSKRFLAHPLVVQQLEAIWAGTIVFHSAADSAHRHPVKITPNQNRGYGATGLKGPILQASVDHLQPAKQRDHLGPMTIALRRSATLYDAREASLFKLSRLRVPRYRQFLSTCSFAALLGLYLAVLAERSLTITPLEIVFWIWSAGFMLDEVVGFNEQGFSLYILSFWNTFDVGILLLLICFYVLRLGGLAMPDARERVAGLAYDILAADAVLLFPRLFSVLDHYRYFSQLLIAFRMMAMDLVAVFVLIIVSCSGFFVAFTLSFGNDEAGPSSVAYALFQMLMGFTPAAWEVWDRYNMLGKAILTLFLFICHFLIVTILITVLTNSFMAIVQNATEEHQFVFAVNTISMVKSDALFSYVAPSNVLAWLLAPLRYVLPFRQFVRVNRIAIKVTHFPVLFLIYAYERLILKGKVFDSTDLVEQRGRSGPEVRAFEAPGAGVNVFSPKQSRLREPSIATFHKDRALDEVFRRPFRDNTVRNGQKSHERRKTSNVVNNWMSNMGPDGTASPPVEQDHSVVDKLEARRLAHRRSQLVMRRRQAGRGRDFTAATMSVVSDPEEFVGAGPSNHPRLGREDSSLPTMNFEGPTQTDADNGDDELVTNDDDELLTLDRPSATPLGTTRRQVDSKQDDYFHQPPTSKPRIPYFAATHTPSYSQSPSNKSTAAGKAAAQRPGRTIHARNISTNTILYDPPVLPSDSTSSPSRKAITMKNSARNTGTATPAASAGRRTPKRLPPGAARARPIMPPRHAFQSAPNLAMLGLSDTRHDRHNSLTLDIGSDLGDNKASGGGWVGAVPASFATQMAFATRPMRTGRNVSGSNDDQQRMSKLMLARMNGLEESFREVLKEVKDWRKEETRSVGDVRGEIDVGGLRGKRSKMRESTMKPRFENEDEDNVWEVEEGPRGSSL